MRVVVVGGKDMNMCMCCNCGNFLRSKLISTAKTATGSKTPPLHSIKGCDSDNYSSDLSHLLPALLWHSLAPRSALRQHTPDKTPRQPRKRNASSLPLPRPNNPCLMVLSLRTENADSSQRQEGVLTVRTRTAHTLSNQVTLTRSHAVHPPHTHAHSPPWTTPSTR